MGKTIDELDFQLVLDDKKFDKQVKADIKLAKDLNTQLSNLLGVKKQVAAVSAQDVANHRRSLQIQTESVRQANLQAREKIRTAIQQERLNQLMAKGNQHQSASNRLLKEAGAIATSFVSIVGAERLIKNLVRITGEFELQRTTLRAMLQDNEGADSIFGQIKELALISPFTFKELASYAKQLSAYSIPIDELYDTTKQLADVSAGLGVDMNRLVLAYGQIRSASFLRGQEVRQLTEAGIPILDELAKQFSQVEGRMVAAGEVFDKISARQVPFEMVKKVFEEMTSEGGKFYQMQEIQAETLKGKLSNLQDAWEIMLSDVGTEHSDFIKGTVDGLRNLIANYQRVGAVLVDLIAVYGAYKAVAGLFWISDTIIKFGGLTNAIKATTVAQRLLNSALLTNPYVLLATAIAAVCVQWHRAYTNAHAFENAIRDIANEKAADMDKLIDRFRTLSESLENATKGSQDYRDAISKINREYGDYLPQLLDEKNALEQLREASDAVTQSIQNRAKAYAVESAQRKVEELYGETRDSYANLFIEKLVDKGISERAARDLFANFNKAIKRQTGIYNPAEVFNKVYKEYFGTDKEFFSGFSDFLNDVKQGTPFIRNIYKGNTTGWQTARDALWNYCLVLNDVNDATREYNRIIDARFGTQYDTQKEREKVEAINKTYDEGVERLRSSEMSLQEYQEAIKNLDIAKLKALVSTYKELDRMDLANKYQKDLDALTKLPTGWQALVAEALRPFGVKGKGAGDMGLWADEATPMLDYIDDLRKAYKGLDQQIKDTAKANPTLNAQLTEQKDAIEAVAKALGITLEIEKKGSGGSHKGAAQLALEARIDLIKKLQSAYEKLATFEEDANIPPLLMSLFSDAGVTEDMVKNLDFREQLVDLAQELARFDELAAEKLLNYVGYDKVGDAIQQLKDLYNAKKAFAEASSKYSDYMSSWIPNEDISGTGSTYKITKAASDYRRELEQINAKRAEAIARLEAERAARLKVIRLDAANSGKTAEETDALIAKAKATEDLFSAKREDEIATRRDTSAQAAYAKAVQNTTNQAEAFFKEWADVQGLDLTNWSNKSIFELNQIKKAIEDFDASNIPDEIKAALQEAGIDIELLKSAIQAVVNSTGEKVDKQAREKKWQAVRETIGMLQDLADTLGEYADAAGNDTLKNIANGLSFGLEFVSTVGEKVAQGDYIGASISGLTQIVNKVMEAATAEAKLESAIRQAAAAQKVLNAEMAINRGTEYLMGTADFTKFVNSFDVATEKYKDAAKDLEETKKKLSGGKGNDTKGIATATGVAAGAAAGAAIGVWFFGIGALIGAAVGAAVGGVAGAIVDVSMTIDNYNKTLAEMAEEINAPLIDAETGLLNKQTLQTILDTYSDLDNSSKEFINNLIANLEAYEKAVEELKSSISDMFGDIAGDVATTIVDAFKEAGKAALDYADIMDSVATNIAASILKSHLLANVFTDDMAMEAARKLASGDVAGALATVEKAMQVAEDFMPYYQQLLESMQPYFNMGNGSDSTGMTQGLQSLTETTGDLLASYINAIRADVSFIKKDNHRTTEYLRSILMLLPSSPKLADYLAAIQANTYNSATLLQEIRLLVESVMTSEGGSTSIRTFMQ